jgi:predicted aminopeptidase
MKQNSTQHGLTVISLLIWVTILGLGVLVGLKVFPIYMESFKIDTAMKGVIREPSLSEKTKQEIAKSLLKRFQVDNVRRIDSRNYRNYIKIDKKKDTVAIAVSYRAETPLFANLSLVADFNKQVQN